MEVCLKYTSLLGHLFQPQLSFCSPWVLWFTLPDSWPLVYWTHRPFFFVRLWNPSRWWPAVEENHRFDMNEIQWQHSWGWWVLAPMRKYLWNHSFMGASQFWKLWKKCSVGLPHSTEKVSPVFSWQHPSGQGVTSFKMLISEIIQGGSWVLPAMKYKNVGQTG